jgi:TusA-related sulfurtransferase
MGTLLVNTANIDAKGAFLINEFVNSNAQYFKSKESILELAYSIIKIYNGDEAKSFVYSTSQVSKKDLRGVAFPLNFIRTKIQLSNLQKGDVIEIIIDKSTSKNFSDSIINEGHKIVNKKHSDNHSTLTIQKVIEYIMD